MRGALVGLVSFVSALTLVAQSPTVAPGDASLVRTQLIGERRNSDGWVVAATTAGPRIVWDDRNRLGGSLIIDGQPTGPFERIQRHYNQWMGHTFLEVAIGRTGRVAFPVRVEGQWKVFVDNVAGPAFRDAPWGVQFSSDGEHVGYVAEDGKTRAWFVDHVKQFDVEADDLVSASSDLSEVAYLGRDGRPWHRSRAGAARRLNDGRPNLVEVTHRPWSSLHRPYPSFFLIGGKPSRTVYVSGTRLYTDGVAGDNYDIVHSPRIGADGSVAYVGMMDRFGFDNIGDVHVVKDGKPSPAYEWVTAPVFTDDGQHWAYAALKGTAAFGVVDGAVAPGEITVGNASRKFVQFAQLDRTGKRLAYVVVEAGRTFSTIPFSMLRHPLTQQYQSVVETGPALRRVIVDGVEVARYDAALSLDNLQFLETGELMFEVHKPGASAIVIAGRELAVDKSVDELVCGTTVVETDRTVTYLVRTDRLFQKVVDRRAASAPR
jgi:hypothetical protein